MLDEHRLRQHIQAEYSQQWDILLQQSKRDAELQAVCKNIFERVKHGVVIDVGAGQGRKMAALFSKIGAYVGVDPEPRHVATNVDNATFVEDDIISFLQDPARFEQFKGFGSRNFMFNGIDSIATSIPFDDVAQMLIFYLKPSDYVFGIYSPEMVDALRRMPDIYEEVYHRPEKNSFFAFRMRSVKQEKNEVLRRTYT